MVVYLGSGAGGSPTPPSPTTAASSPAAARFAGILARTSANSAATPAATTTTASSKPSTSSSSVQASSTTTTRPAASSPQFLLDRNSTGSLGSSPAPAAQPMNLSQALPQLRSRTTRALATYNQKAAQGGRNSGASTATPQATTALQTATAQEEVADYQQGHHLGYAQYGTAAWNNDFRAMLADSTGLAAARNSVMTAHQGDLTAANGLDAPQLTANLWAGEAVQQARLAALQGEGKTGTERQANGEQKAVGVIATALADPNRGPGNDGLDPTLARRVLQANAYVASGLPAAINRTIRVYATEKGTAAAMGLLSSMSSAAAGDPQWQTTIIGASADTMHGLVKSLASAPSDQAAAGYVASARVYLDLRRAAQSSHAPGASALADAVAQWSYDALNATSAASRVNMRFGMTSQSALDAVLQSVITQAKQQGAPGNLFQAWLQAQDRGGPLSSAPDLAGTAPGTLNDAGTAWSTFQQSLQTDLQLAPRSLTSAVPGDPPTVASLMQSLQDKLRAGQPLSEAIGSARAQMVAEYGSLPGQIGEKALSEAALTLVGENNLSAYDQHPTLGNDPIATASSQIASLGVLDPKVLDGVANTMTAAGRPDQVALQRDSGRADTAARQWQADRAAGKPASVIGRDEQAYHTALQAEMNDAVGAKGSAWLNDPTKIDQVWKAERAVAAANPATLGSTGGTTGAADRLQTLFEALSILADVGSVRDPAIAARHLTGDLQGVSNAVSQEVMGDGGLQALQDTAQKDVLDATGTPQSRLSHAAAILAEYQGTVLYTPLLSAIEASPVTEQLFTQAASGALAGPEKADTSLTNMASALNALRVDPDLAAALYQDKFAGRVQSWIDGASDPTTAYTALGNSYLDVGGALSAQGQQLRRTLEAQLAGGKAPEQISRTGVGGRAAFELGNAVVTQSYGLDALKADDQPMQLYQDMIDDAPNASWARETMKETGFTPTSVGQAAKPINAAGSDPVGLPGADGLAPVTTRADLINELGQAEGLTPVRASQSAADQAAAASGQFARYDLNQKVYGNTTLGNILQSVLTASGVTNVSAQTPVVLSAMPIDFQAQSGGSPQALSLLDVVGPNGQDPYVGPADTTVRSSFADWMDHNGFAKGTMSVQPHMLVGENGQLLTGNAYWSENQTGITTWDKIKTDTEIGLTVAAGLLTTFVAPESAPLWLAMLSDAADMYFTVSSTIGTAQAVQSLTTDNGYQHWQNWLDLGANVFGAAAGAGAIASRSAAIAGRLGVESDGFAQAAKLTKVTGGNAELKAARTDAAANAPRPALAFDSGTAAKRLLQSAVTRGPVASAVRRIDEVTASPVLTDATGDRATLRTLLQRGTPVRANRAALAYRTTGVLALGTNLGSMANQYFDMKKYGATSSQELQFAVSAGLLGLGFGVGMAHGRAVGPASPDTVDGGASDPVAPTLEQPRADGTPPPDVPGVDSARAGDDGTPALQPIEVAGTLYVHVPDTLGQLEAASRLGSPSAGGKRLFFKSIKTAIAQVGPDGGGTVVAANPPEAQRELTSTDGQILVRGDVAWPDIMGGHAVDARGRPGEFLVNADYSAGQPFDPGPIPQGNTEAVMAALRGLNGEPAPGASASPFQRLRLRLALRLYDRELRPPLSAAPVRDDMASMPLRDHYSLSAALSDLPLSYEAKVVMAQDAAALPAGERQEFLGRLPTTPDGALQRVADLGYGATVTARLQARLTWLPEDQRQQVLTIMLDLARFTNEMNAGGELTPSERASIPTQVGQLETLTIGANVPARFMQLDDAALSRLDEVSIVMRARGIRAMLARNGIDASAGVIEDLIGQRVAQAANSGHDTVTLKTGVITGFTVAPDMPETDGPPGASWFGHDLQQIEAGTFSHEGKQVAVKVDLHYITDDANVPVLEATNAASDVRNATIHTIDVGPVDQAAAQAAGLLDEHQFDLMVSTERPGANPGGDFENMRGVVITGYNAHADVLLGLARERGIPTVAMGDGGNEAGMGDANVFMPRWVLSMRGNLFLDDMRNIVNNIRDYVDAQTPQGGPTRNTTVADLLAHLGEQDQARLAQVEALRDYLKIALRVKSPGLHATVAELLDAVDGPNAPKGPADDIFSVAGVQHPATAWASNSGVAAIGARLLQRLNLLDRVHTPEHVKSAILASGDAGAVDGVTRLRPGELDTSTGVQSGVDGLSIQAHIGFWHLLQAALRDDPVEAGPEHSLVDWHEAWSAWHALFGLQDRYADARLRWYYDALLRKAVPQAAVEQTDAQPSQPDTSAARSQAVSSPASSSTPPAAVSDSPQSASFGSKLRNALVTSPTSWKAKVTWHAGMFALTLPLAEYVPVHLLAIGNGLGFAMRGLGTVEPRLAQKFPRLTASWNGLSLVFNGAFHLHATLINDWLHPSRWNWKSQPHNALYAGTDIMGGVRQSSQLSSGEAYAAKRAEQHAFLAMATAANSLLMANFSIPSGRDYEITTTAFLGGVGYALGKNVAVHVGERFFGKDPESWPKIDSRVANIAAATGMAAFGVVYVINQLYSAPVLATPLNRTSPSPTGGVTSSPSPSPSGTPAGTGTTPTPTPTANGAAPTPASAGRTPTPASPGRTSRPASPRSGSRNRRSDAAERLPTRAIREVLGLK
jgi:hypothetical protein